MNGSGYGYGRRSPRGVSALLLGILEGATAYRKARVDAKDLRERQRGNEAMEARQQAVEEQERERARLREQADAVRKMAGFDPDNWLAWFRRAEEIETGRARVTGYDAPGYRYAWRAEWGDEGEDGPAGKRSGDEMLRNGLLRGMRGERQSPLHFEMRQTLRSRPPLGFEINVPRQLSSLYAGITPGRTPEEIKSQQAAAVQSARRQWEARKLFNETVQRQHQHLLLNTDLSPDEAWEQALEHVGSVLGWPEGMNSVPNAARRAMEADRRTLDAIPQVIAERVPRFGDLPVKTRGQAEIADRIARTKKTTAEMDAIPRGLELREQALRQHDELGRERNRLAAERNELTRQAHMQRLTPEQQVHLRGLERLSDTINRQMEIAYRTLNNPPTDKSGRPIVDLNAVRKEWGALLEISEMLVEFMRATLNGTVPDGGFAERR